MPNRISDYALIGDTHSAALVGRDGSIDWLCWPRFDSDACFAAIVGTADNGRWQIAPSHKPAEIVRRYRRDTLVLETDFRVAGGIVRVTDCMPPRHATPDLVRVVEGIEGTVDMRMVFAARFGYGDRRPWVQFDHDCVRLTSAPDSLVFWSDVPVRECEGDLIAELRMRAGDRRSFALAWHAAHEPAPRRPDPEAQLAETQAWWTRWMSHCTYDGPWPEAVRRSLIILKALTYAPTGGIVAAPTTSLPEKLGGVRNWDYRYCWIRDATLTLYALLDGGFREEADAFRAWIERTARGEPSRLQIMYGIGGERRLTELELPWLAGYEQSIPVRVGNAAASQFQLDVYGELIDCLHHARSHGLPPDPDIWALQGVLLEHLERVWREPDEGIWETRGPRQHFTHSKVMAWVAFDRMIKDARRLGLGGPIDRWQAIRDSIHADVCTRGFDPDRNTFTQAYGSSALDASLLLIPTVGFLPAVDPRVRGTVEAIRSSLRRDGLVLRYDSREVDDGLPPGEGVFLPCSFWLADSLHLAGDEQGARDLFEQLLALGNDVGLLAEEVDPISRHLLGNFPQAFSHVALVNTAMNLSSGGPADRRSIE